MDDAQILEQIDALVDEERRLRRGTAADAPADRDRIQRLEETLDQCWDLLRRRRARREYGGAEDDARPRDPGTVEGYLQ